MQCLGAAFQRLPRVQLHVLDAILKHPRTLIYTTTAEESNEVYITKLALSVGHTIVQPKLESELSIQGRHPTLLFIDLQKNYDAMIFLPWQRHDSSRSGFKAYQRDG
ncbi:hypothetical protein FPV67DRAFT_1681303 [Lyophyllum atratum]|nr:hypothetical protein FPV67DRAFT_1681303 [Lyophyllum atratum]